MTGDTCLYMDSSNLLEDETLFDYNEETIKEQMLIESLTIESIGLIKEGHCLEYSGCSMNEIDCRALFCVYVNRMYQLREMILNRTSFTSITCNSMYKEAVHVRDSLSLSRRQW